MTSISSPTKIPAARFIATTLSATTAYGEMLLKDIPAEQFAHMPHEMMNHPAFCVGHLSIYPDRVIELLGRPDLVKRRDGYAELFSAGVACVDDAGRYPNKDELVTYYLDRYRVAEHVLSDVADEVLSGDNPAEGPFKEMLPTIGSVANFLLNNHHMAHLGQISAWRRAVGLKGVM